ncbi:ankyrin repeat-containing domain protein [Umbelopsis sp. AD052]|nr:ankyrin repeat-containing domain protein [Umbelopsis sp. AD052]
MAPTNTPSIQLANIWTAAGDGQLDRVKELVESGIDTNCHDDFGYTPLHAAASYGHLDVIEYLISQGGNIDIEDFDGDTPLFVVESPEAAKFLIENGADASHRNHEGTTPAINAASEGWREVAEEIAKVTGETLTEEEDEDELAHVAVGDDEDDGAFLRQVEQVIQQTEQDGMNRDEQLRGLVSQMVMRQIQEDSKK